MLSWPFANTCSTCCRISSLSASNLLMWNFADAFSSSLIHCWSIAFSSPYLMYSLTVHLNSFSSELVNNFLASVMETLLFTAILWYHALILPSNSCAALLYLFSSFLMYLTDLLFADCSIWSNLFFQYSPDFAINNHIPTQQILFESLETGLQSNL